GHVVLRLRELQAAELAPRLHVLRREGRVLLERGDGVRRVALRLVRRRKVAEALLVGRVLLDLAERLRHRGAAAPEEVQAVEELVEAAAARADAEPGEGDREQ